jgi:flagellar hook-associated protein 2
MGITFSGLASGLDTDGIITSLMKIEQVPLTALTTKKTNVDSASKTLASISTKLVTLRDAALSLSKADSFASFKASSSDTAVVASSTGASAPGAYALQVTQLAREQRTYSNPIAANTGAMGQAGTVSLRVGGGTAIDVSIDAGDSLGDVAAKINGSGAAVTASVLFDGTAYRLQVRGKDTGAANAVSFTETGTTFGFADPANTAQSAQDAKMLVDGITITRPTNQVTGVIPGVTLALTKTTTAPIDIKVETDPDALSAKLTELARAYSDVVTSSHLAAGYGSATASNAELASDSTLRTTLSRLTAVTGSTVAGTTGKYTSLASVGLIKQNDGTLKLDSVKLKAAIDADPAAVAKLFIDDGTGNSAMAKLSTSIKELAVDSGNMFQTRIDGYGTKSTRLTKEADAMTTRIAQKQTQLRAQFTSLESRVSAYQAQFSSLTASLTSSS